MDGYRALRAWQLCHRLSIEVYRVTEAFPADERYELTRQMRRAAVSAAANVAEGWGRRTAREFRQFLGVALGSLAELSSQMDVAAELRYIGSDRLDDLRRRHTEAGKATWGLYRSRKGRA